MPSPARACMSRSGLTWSHERYNISGAYRKTDIDYSNEWGGAVLEGWSIGKPLIAHDNATVYMQFSKVSSAAGRSEGFFFRSTNALTPGITPDKMSFELVPRGDFGLRAAEGTSKIDRLSRSFACGHPACCQPEKHR